MRKQEEPRKPHVVKTAGREIGGRAKGLGLSFLGTICSIAGLIVFFLALEGSIAQTGMIVGFIILAVGVLFSGFGSYMRRKARHVAWTQEAIERERYAAGKEMKCPQCGAWNPREGNYCTECSLPLKVKCVQCGAFNFRDAKFCADCGRPLTAVGK